uniref:Protein kinase domain-containing protein n=1 Tax=Populus alba TaxID=43335 RepID=A0A4U5Q8H4_POPAL|nr:hypothetical protein D5086_0000126660 [Populus alba]
MAPVPLLVFFALFHPLLICASKDDGWAFNKCPPFNCGKLGEIRFPFTNNTSPEICGPYVVDGCHEQSQRIQLERGGKWFELNSISQADTISITDEELGGHLNSNSCDSFKNLSLPASLPYFSILEFSNLTLFKCTDPSVNFPQHLEFNYTGCKNFSIYYTRDTSLPSPPPTCSILQLPVNNTESYGDIFRLLTATFSIEVFVRPPCYHCYLQRGECNIIKGKFKCIHSIEGLGVPFMVLIILVSIFFIRWHRHKRTHISSNVNSANASSDPSSKSDPEGDTNYFGVPIFSYSELEEATNNFDSKHELGDGGFGTVYYGKLRDGREVAVKRLYEHNRKRIKQFMNEIQILTRLRHKNLVSLYGNQHEINLATFAMNKIQKCAFDELIDPYLGYKSDEEIKRMTTSVAELAFLCLQQGKEIRPCMNEVLKELKAMESGGYELENLEQEHGDTDASKKKEPPDCDVVALLKNIRSPLSSNSTTDQWFSSSTTPNLSN